jgi:hypothetical protein
MYLVDDIYTVFSHLRRYTDLIHQGLDILDSVVGSRVKFMYAIGTAFCKREA